MVHLNLQGRPWQDALQACRRVAVGHPDIRLPHFPQDPFLGDVTGWGYQGLQPHQEAVVAAAEKVLDKLRARAAERGVVAAPAASGAGQEVDGVALL